MPVRNALHCFLAGALVACATSLPIAAQSNSSVSNLGALNVTAAAATPIEASSGYNQPPKNILDVMHAPSPPMPRVSPTQDAILLVSWQDYPSISRVATPFLRLAGVRVETKKSQQARHSGRLRHHTLRPELRAGAHRRCFAQRCFAQRRRANSYRASRRRLPRRAHLGRGRKAIRLCEPRSRGGRTLDRRRQDWRSPSSFRSASQSHVQRRDAMDA